MKKIQTLENINLFEFWLGWYNMISHENSKCVDGILNKVTFACLIIYVAAYAYPTATWVQRMAKMFKSGMVKLLFTGN